MNLVMLSMALAALFFSAADARAVGKIEKLRFWSNPSYTRVVIDCSEESRFWSNTLPGDAKKGIDPRIYVDLAASDFAPGVASNLQVDDGLLKQVRTGRPKPGRVRVVLDLVSLGTFKVFTLKDPYRVVIDVANENTPSLKSHAPELRASPAAKSDGIAGILDRAPRDDREIHLKIPAGDGKLRRIVVDAGHGGKDPGAIGPNGVYEKDVVLALAKKLARQLRKELGCEVILTRDKDVFLPLEERTAIANRVGADLFISLHVNASPNRSVFGTETYYLNLSKNNQAASVAARENGISLKEVSDLEAILLDLMANSKITESSRLAAEIQNSLIDELSRSFSNIKNRGVYQGPFYVLLGATMPSILVEVGFISNHREGKRLSDPHFQDKTALAIVKGVESYAKALNLMARK